MSVRLDVISIDYVDGNIVMVINFWGDKMTISVPLPKTVIKKIINSNKNIN